MPPDASFIRSHASDVAQWCSSKRKPWIVSSCWTLYWTEPLRRQVTSESRAVKWLANTAITESFPLPRHPLQKTSDLIQNTPLWEFGQGTLPLHCLFQTIARLFYIHEELMTRTLRYRSFAHQALSFIQVTFLWRRPQMAPQPRQRLNVSKERFSAHFSSLRTQTYLDPGSRGPGFHGYVLQNSSSWYLPSIKLILVPHEKYLL